MMHLAGFSPVLGAIAGLIIWAVHFGVVYVANAIACERGLAGRSLLGQPLVPVMVLAATTVALGILGLIGLRAWRRLDHGLAGEDGEDGTRFTAWLTTAITALSALAVLWEGLTVLFVRPCA